MQTTETLPIEDDFPEVSSSYANDIVMQDFIDTQFHYGEPISSANKSQTYHTIPVPPLTDEWNYYNSTAAIEKNLWCQWNQILSEHRYRKKVKKN